MYPLGTAALCEHGPPLVAGLGTWHIVTSLGNPWRVATLATVLHDTHSFTTHTLTQHRVTTQYRQHYTHDMYVPSLRYICHTACSRRHTALPRCSRVSPMLALYTVQ